MTVPASVVATQRRLVLGLGILIAVGAWNGLVRGLVGFPVLAAVLDLVLLCLLAVAGAGAVRGSTRPRVVLADGLVLLYALMSAVWILHPNVPGAVTGLEGFRKAAFPVVAYALMRMALVTDAGPLLRVIVIGSMPAFLFACRQYFVPLPIDQSIIGSTGVSWETFMQRAQLRAFSPTSGPFHLGMLAGAAVIAGLVMSRARDRRWLVPMVVATITLALTLARAIWIATLIGAVLSMGAYVVATRVPARPRRRAVRTGTVTIVAAVCLIAVATLGAVAAYWVASQATDRGSVVLAVLDPKNMLLRLEYWAAFLPPILDSPWVGYGTSAADDGAGATYLAAGALHFYPHSIFFKPLLELGLGGFLLFAGALLAIVRSTVAGLRRAPESASITIGVLTLTAVAGVTGPMLDAYPFNLLFWALAGIVVNIESTAPASARLTGVGPRAWLRQPDDAQGGDAPTGFGGATEER